MTQLRREGEAQARRIEILEDRVLRLEQGESPPNKRSEGSVSLSPTGADPEGHSASTDGSTEGSISLSDAPRNGRSSIRLDRVPMGAAFENPALWDDPAGLDPQATGEVDSLGSSDSSWGHQYRLVGSRLVQLTKTKGPSGPDRPPKDSQGRNIRARYEDAMALYRRGDIVAAEAAFGALADGFPKSDYADNALYWKGESAYDQGHYADALAAFTGVVERYGGGNKAPDALLKIGLCYDKLGDTDNARDVLGQLIAAYPEASASDIARIRIAELERQS